MKISAKILAIILCVFMLIPSFLPSVKAESNFETKLSFNENGEFKILNLSDIQTFYPMKRVNKKLIRDYVETENPDLIVLTGDQIVGSTVVCEPQLEAIIDTFMSIFEELNIPVALVFGNHDAEGIYASKDRQMAIYETYSCFIGSAGVVLGNRLGNYNLPIYSADGKNIVFNLYFTDSGMYNDENVTDEGKYACVTERQIEWYKEVSDSLKKQNNGKPVPSINFQHIIVPEIFDALEETDNEQEIKWALPNKAEGVLGEKPCPPAYSNGQFDAFISQGDVIATVSGHDHVNTFVVNHKGVDIVNTPICTFSSYNDENLGYRVITLNEKEPEKYETHTVTYSEFYKNDEDAALRFNAHSDAVSIFTKIPAFIQYNTDYSMIIIILSVVIITAVILIIKKKKHKNKN